MFRVCLTIDSIGKKTIEHAFTAVRNNLDTVLKQYRNNEDIDTIKVNGQETLVIFEEFKSCQVCNCSYYQELEGHSAEQDDICEGCRADIEHGCIADPNEDDEEDKDNEEDKYVEPAYRFIAALASYEQDNMAENEEDK